MNTNKGEHVNLQVHVLGHGRVHGPEREGQDMDKDARLENGHCAWTWKPGMVMYMDTDVDMDMKKLAGTE
jgi:hypothetical protein